MKEKLKKQEKGITLIALVITIIVLLILAGVSISMLSGENGILKIANDTKEATEIAEQDEENSLSSTEFTIDYATNKGEKIISKGMMTGITPGTTVEDFQAELQKISTDYLIGDVNGNTENVTGKNLSTGMTIVKNEKIIQTIVILGDVNGDGLITGNDKTRMYPFLKDINRLIDTEYKKVAADIDQDGDIDIDDYTLLVNHINGSEINSNIINQNVQAKNKGEDIVVKNTKWYIDNLNLDINKYNITYNESTHKGSMDVSKTSDDITSLKQNLKYSGVTVIIANASGEEVTKISDASKVMVKSELNNGQTLDILDINVNE